MFVTLSFKQKHLESYYGNYKNDSKISYFHYLIQSIKICLRRVLFTNFQANNMTKSVTFFIDLVQHFTVMRQE
jgi:hypothetical protein